MVKELMILIVLNVFYIICLTNAKCNS